MSFGDPFLDALAAERQAAYLVWRQAQRDCAYTVAVVASARMLLATELLAKFATPAATPAPDVEPNGPAADDGSLEADDWAAAVADARRAVQDATTLSIRQERLYEALASWRDQYE